MADQKQSLNKYKADFKLLYNAELPHAYFKTMDQLDYQIPEHAKPIINFLISQLGNKASETVSILDLGCSYGILASLVRFDLTLRSLYDRYHVLTPLEATLENEIQWYANRWRRGDIKFYGIDVSASAIEFATRVGLLDGGVAIDLEDKRNSSHSLVSLPRQVDLIVSTGCVGYITSRTFGKILQHLDSSKPPIIANFVLRAFDYSGIVDIFSEHGFRTTKVANATFVQRKFQDAAEQAKILSLLSDERVHPKKPAPRERDGYYYAELFLSVHEDADLSILHQLDHVLSSV